MFCVRFLFVTNWSRVVCVFGLVVRICCRCCCFCLLWYCLLLMLRYFGGDGGGGDVVCVCCCFCCLWCWWWVLKYDVWWLGWWCLMFDVWCMCVNMCVVCECGLCVWCCVRMNMWFYWCGYLCMMCVLGMCVMCVCGFDEVVYIVIVYCLWFKMIVGWVFLIYGFDLMIMVYLYFVNVNDWWNEMF